MVVYKEKSFLVFEMDDGSVVKYDFATKKSIGKSGKPVKNLNVQFRNISLSSIIDSCADVQYGRFLHFVQQCGGENGGYISNIGTILSRCPRFARFEQIYSAGIQRVEASFKYTINDIPNKLLKICKEHNLILSNKLLECYKTKPDVYQLAYGLEYDSLNDNDLENILKTDEYVGNDYINGYCEKYRPKIFKLLDEYNYTAFALFKYFDYLKTYEALNGLSSVVYTLCDYANMMSKISRKFDKYPRNLLTTHQIAIRNYDRLNKEFSEQMFAQRINTNMEHTFGDYQFIYPRCVQDIKDEAVQQNNCVASYIDDVIKGNCDILFLRNKNTPKTSLVTIEVKNNEIVQAKQKFNAQCTLEQEYVIGKWNAWWAEKCADTCKDCA